MAFTGNFMATSFKVGLMNGVTNFQTGTGCTFTGSTGGSTTLTVSAVASGTLFIGMGITTAAAPNTTIGYITAYGTGTGGAGTYTLSASSTVGSTSMVGGAFFIALYDNTPSFTAATTVYTSANEVTNTSGTAYILGGNQLSVSQVPTSSGTTAFISFATTTWATASFTAFGALIYQNATLTIGGSSLVRPVAAVLDFGGAKTSSAANFTIQFPAADASNAIIRIA
jgi:hypothetical protein